MFLTGSIRGLASRSGFAGDADRAYHYCKPFFRGDYPFTSSLCQKGIRRPNRADWRRHDSERGRGTELLVKIPVEIMNANPEFVYNAIAHNWRSHALAVRRVHSRVAAATLFRRMYS